MAFLGFQFNSLRAFESSKVKSFDILSIMIELTGNPEKQSPILPIIFAIA